MVKNRILILIVFCLALITAYSSTGLTGQVTSGTSEYAVETDSIYAADVFSSEWECASGLECEGTCNSRPFQIMSDEEASTQSYEYTFTAPQADRYTCTVTLRTSYFSDGESSEVTDVYINDELIGNTQDECCPEVCGLPSPTWLFAVPKGSGRVYLGWRMVSWFPDGGYNVYRSASSGGPYSKLNANPVTDSTNYIDNSAVNGNTYHYVVRLVGPDGTESGNSNEAAVTATTVNNMVYRELKNVFPENDYGGMMFARPGDVTGDGLTDYIVTGYPYFTSQGGPETVKVYLDDGSLAWEIENGFCLGEPGVPGCDYERYTWLPWIAWDLDNDGEGEIMGFRSEGGNRYFTVKDGATGGTEKEMPYSYMLDRAGLVIGYLDGKNPYVITQEGVYPSSSCVLRAYDRDLNLVWKNSRPGGSTCVNTFHYGGGHGLTVADIDEDGKDEIFYGALLADDDGSTIWEKELRHPDGTSPRDIRPDIPGLEILYSSCDYCYPWGLKLFDKDGNLIWERRDDTRHAHTGFIADVRGDYPGKEIFVHYKNSSAGMSEKYLYSAYGKVIMTGFNILLKPVRWEGDGYEEVLVHDRFLQHFGESGGNNFDQILALDGPPLIAADVIGDYREEIIARSSSGGYYSLKIYTNTNLNTRKEASPWEDRRYAEHVNQISYWDGD